MNKIYHTVWNEVAGTWVAVSENVAARGKEGSSKNASGLNFSHSSRAQQFQLSKIVWAILASVSAMVIPSVGFAQVITNDGSVPVGYSATNSGGSIISQSGSAGYGYNAILGQTIINPSDAAAVGCTGSVAACTYSYGTQGTGVTSTGAPVINLGTRIYNPLTLTTSVADTIVAGIAAGQISATSNDAINGSQLYVVQQQVLAATTEVVAGTNVASVGVTTDAIDGHTVYTVNADGAKVSAGSTAVTVTAGTKDANNVTDYAVDLSAATKASLANADKGWNTTTAATGTGTVSGTSVTNVAPGATVTTTAGDNISITQSGADLTIATNPNVTFTNLTVSGTTNLQGPTNIAGTTTITGDTTYTGPITNVNNIVNKSYVDSVAAAATTEVAAGTNVASVGVTTDAIDGHTIYTVNADGATVSAAASGALTVVKSVPDANNVTDYSVDLSQTTKDSLANADKGWNTTTAATGTGTVSGTSVTNVAPGATVTTTAGDNISITQSGTDLTIATNPNVTFTNLTVSGTTNLQGPTNIAGTTTITGDTTYTGPITNVNNIVNKSYVDSVAAAATTEVAAGTNVASVGVTTDAIDGHTIYTVNADGATVSAAASGALTVVKSVPDANNVTDYSVDLSQTTKDSLANADKGWNTTTAAAGTGTVSGTSVTNVAPGATVTTTAGDNISITQSGTDLTIATNPNVTFNSVTTTNLTATGDTNLNNLDVTGITNLQGNTTITGNTTYTGPMTSGDNIVNKTYVDTSITNTVTGNPLTFTGDTGTNVVKLGETLNVVGGSTGTLTDGNIGVVANGTDTLTVKLNKDLNLGTDGSVTIGGTVINGTSVTTTNLTATGDTNLNNLNVTGVTNLQGDTTITGNTTYTGPMTNVNNIVNKSYVDNVAAAATTHYYSVNSTNTAAGSNYNNDGATGVDALAAGVAASATASGGVAIGSNTIVAGGNGVAIGSGASAGQSVNGAKGNAVAIGNNAQARKVGSVAIGESSGLTAQANLTAAEVLNPSAGVMNVAIGSRAGREVLSNANVAIGQEAGQNIAALSTGNVAIGLYTGQNITTGNGFVHGGNTALGTGSGWSVAGDLNVGTGWQAGRFVTGDQNVGVGALAGKTVKGNNNIGMGTFAGYNVEGNRNVAIGNSAGSTAGATAVIADDTVSIGSSALANANSAIAIGTGAVASGLNAISIGTGNIVSGEGSGAIGDPTTITGAGTYTLGNDNGTIAANNSGVFGNDNTITGALEAVRVIGNANTVSANGAMVMGNSATVSAVDGVALGSNTSVTQVGGVALGQGSTADTASGILGYVPTGADATAIYATVATRSAVDVGSRQITSVAAGTADDDAVNVSQLKAVANMAVNPLTFAGDTGTNVARKLGETLNVVGGSTGTLTDGNIGVVADGTDTLTVKLNKDLNLGTDGSVTIGDTVINGTSVTTTDVFATNLTATGDTNLNNLTATGDTNLNNLTVTGITNLQGDTTITGNTTYTGPMTGDTNIVNKTYVDTSIVNAIASSPLTFGGDSGTDVVRQLGETLNVIGGVIDPAQLVDGNIGVVADGTDTLTVKLNKDLNLGTDGSVTIGGTVINGTSVTTTDVFTTNLTATGNTNLNNLNVTGITNLQGDTTIAGNTTITGNTTYTGPMTGDTNIVNKSYVDTSITNTVTGNPLTFTGDTGTNVVRKLGETLNVVGGSTGTLTDGNIGVVANGTDTLTVKLSADLTGLNSVSIVGGPTINASGIDMAGKTITNLAAGSVSATSTDAINGNQLYALGSGVQNIIGGTTTYDPTTGTYTNTNIGGTGQSTIDAAIASVSTAATQAKSTVSAGNNIVVNSSLNSDGSTNYTVATSDNVNFTNVNTTNLTVTGETKLGDNFTVNNDGSVIYTGPVTNDNSIVNKTYVDNSISTITGTVNSGLNFSADSGAVVNRKLGDTVAITGDGNITTTTTENGVQIGLSNNLDFNNVTVNQNLSVAEGATVNMGGNVIQNVGAGVADTDAVNVGQLKNIANHVGKIEDKLSGGIAASAALAVVTPVEPGTYHLSGGAAYYNGGYGVGFNLLKRSDSGRTTMHAGVGWGSGGGGALVRVGAGFSFGGN